MPGIDFSRLWAEGSEAFVGSPGPSPWVPSLALLILFSRALRTSEEGLHKLGSLGTCPLSLPACCWDSWERAQDFAALCWSPSCPAVFLPTFRKGPSFASWLSIVPQSHCGSGRVPTPSPPSSAEFLMQWM